MMAKRRYLWIPASIAAVACLAVASASPASANDEETLSRTLAELPLEYGVNTANVESLSSRVVAGEPLHVLDSDGAITDVAIRLTTAGDFTSVLPLGDGREAANRSDDTSTVAQQKTDGSVQIITTISSSASPSEYAYDVSLPDGTRMYSAEDGSIVAVDQDGKFVAGVHAPWAVDANGSAVPTHFAIDGNRLTQTVQHSDEYAYPIVADPWLGAELYGGVGITDTAEGYVVTTTPTEWGALHSGPNNLSMWWAHADEVKGKMPGGYSWTLSLQEQLYCHIAGYPISANPSYDLESWKPHVRWEDQISSKCLGGYSVGS